MPCELLALADDGCPLHASDPDPQLIVAAICWAMPVANPQATPPHLIAFEVSRIDSDADEPALSAMPPSGDDFDLSFRATGPNEKTFPGFKVYGVGTFPTESPIIRTTAGKGLAFAFAIRLGHAVHLFNRLAFFGFRLSDAAGRFADAHHTAANPATVADLYPVSFAAAWDALHEAAEGDA